MTTTRISIIFNPTASGGRAVQQAPALRKCLATFFNETSLTHLEWLETQAPGHAITLAQEAACAGSDLVVAVGGDGTVNEVINGLVQAREQGHIARLGVIPTGSGNDFAWWAGIPDEPLAACERLRDGQPRLVDLGHIRQAGGQARYFGNCCGVGFDAIVSLEAKQLKKRLKGFMVYVVAVLKTIILRHNIPALRINLDGQEMVHPTIMLTLGNGRRHGGGFLVTPEAEMDDGLLDVCIAGQVGRLTMLALIPHFIKGTHVNHKHIRMARARQVRVQAPIPQIIHLDGDVFATDVLQFEIRAVPQALEVIV